LARAKNTDRAAARRRHREQHRADEQQPAGTEVAVATATPSAVPAGPTTTLGSTMRGSLRMPDVREDLRILPGMLLHTRKLWVPFIILIVSFILALLLPTTTPARLLGDGLYVPAQAQTSVLPSGIDRFAALFVQLTLPPTSLFVFFIGGFLAPRASYLVGAVLGIVDGLLWAAYVLIANASAQQMTGSAAPQPTQIPDVIVLVLFAVFIGVLAAGFAAWYRNFLRQSNERARQNRLAREQAAKAKAKEDERKAREEQRKAAASAREEQRRAASVAKAAPKATSSAATAPQPPKASGK
jgi:hypothetical protein